MPKTRVVAHDKGPVAWVAFVVHTRPPGGGRGGNP
jgi:hypothetical protein